MKDKGSYTRCTSCSWAITNGTVSTRMGYAVQLGDDEIPDRIWGL